LQLHSVRAGNPSRCPLESRHEVDPPDPRDWHNGALWALLGYWRSGRWWVATIAGGLVGRLLGMIFGGNPRGQLLNRLLGPDNRPTGRVPGRGVHRGQTERDNEFPPT